MVSTVALLGNSSNFILNSAFAIPKLFSAPTRSIIGFKVGASLNHQPLQKEVANQKLPSIVLHSLRVLEWEKVCDSVASFAGTSLGKQFTKEQLWLLNKTYEDSLRLLKETDAAVEMHKYGAMMDLACIDAMLVKSAMQCGRRGFPVSGNEAMAIVTLLQFAEALQFNVKAAVKDDQDWYQRFMPLSEMILEPVINRSLVKYILQLIDEDGSVKDSASSSLKKARDHVRFLERKLQQLMESLIKNQMRDIPALEVSNVNGRWCIASGTNIRPSVEGLLLSSGSGAGSILEPLSAVPLNDELQQGRAAVAKAEADVLLKITNKMQMDLDNVENIFENMIQLDAINARAKYSISFGGSCPELLLPQEMDTCVPDGNLLEDGTSLTSGPTQTNWSLYLPKACHPLLLWQHRQKLQEATKDLNDANAEIRRRKQGGSMSLNQEVDFSISSLEMQFEEIKQSPPVPIDVFVPKNIRVAVITGPNTGGKTILLKTVGLAAMMAKSGIYVLSSEPVRIPWCDFVFADIGDEQSLSQSLSTFSGHLKQISEILAHSTSRSLVLLDEVGAGTNPLEGAALGMSLLESFAESRPLLTMATTHHGELKTLKYSNNVFENACMEFDEVNLKPTFRILWGVPGRSNAINIAQRLGLPNAILDGARELYGATSAEINEIILDMERFKQNFHKKIQEAEHYLMLSKDLYRQLILANRKVTEYGINQRNEMMKDISKAAAAARSTLHEKLRQQRTFATQGPQHKYRSNVVNKSKNTLMPAHPNGITATKETFRSVGEKESSETSTGIRVATPSETGQPVIEKRVKIPKEGDVVQVPSLNQKAVVLKVEPLKEEILVQAGRLKLKLKLVDVLNR